MTSRPNVVRKRKYTQQKAGSLKAFLRAIYQHMGVWGDYRNRWPAYERDLNERVVSWLPYDPPAVLLSQAAKVRPQADEIRDEFLQAVASIPMKVWPGIQTASGLTADAWWRYYVPALIGYQRMLLEAPVKWQAPQVFKYGLKAIEAANSALLDAVSPVGSDAFVSALVPRSSIKSGIYSFRSRWGTGGGRARLGFHIDYTPAQKQHIQSKVGVRLGYRAGVLLRRDEAAVDPWISWKANDVPGIGSHPAYEVFVQGHVLDRLRERLDLPKMHGAAEYFLGESLRVPKGREYPNGKCLVEYRFGGQLLGHLVVEVIRDIILVKTFLLITMEDTPEGDKLWGALRLRRADFNYWSLGRMSTITSSDIVDDEQLRTIFEDCGCGGLFNVPDLTDPESVKKGVAAELRKYLGLPKGLRPI